MQRKARKGKPWSACQGRRNTRIAWVRAQVEHVFATLAQMGGKRLQGIGLDRAAFQLTGKAATYNLRRLCSLKACGVVAF
ncbi:MAG TPA: transposase [Candidatus Competibacteraceae bacterium]|nr:transposase [Candidatus Competibacteraceae bacterium]